jgi:hypothetical protein
LRSARHRRANISKKETENEVHQSQGTWSLDYAVASVLIGAPFVLRFSDLSVAAAVIAVAAGIGLFVYSLLTNYSAGLRALIPFRVHLVLDASAAVALLTVPFLLGFAGTARVFYLVIGTAVLAVVACTRLEEASDRRAVPFRSTSTLAS